MAQRRNQPPQRPRGSASLQNRNPRQPQNYNRYNNSSVAYDYAALPQYDDYQEELRPIRRPRTKRNLKPRYVKAESQGRMPKLSTFLTMGIVFACGFLCIAALSSNNYLQRTNNARTRELAALNARTQELIVEVSSSMDMELIETIARTRLGMSEPQAHQIVEISVPRQNYTVFNQIDESLTQSSTGAGRRFSFSSLGGIFNNSRG